MGSNLQAMHARVLAMSGPTVDRVCCFCRFLRSTRFMGRPQYELSLPVYLVYLRDAQVQGMPFETAVLLSHINVCQMLSLC